MTSRRGTLLVCLGIFIFAGGGAWLLSLHRGPTIVPSRTVPQYEPLAPTLEMRELNGQPTPFQNGWPYPSGDRQKRPEISLNGLWRKMRVPGNHQASLAARSPKIIQILERESLEAVDPKFDDAGWNT